MITDPAEGVSPAQVLPPPNIPPPLVLGRGWLPHSCWKEHANILGGGGGDMSLVPFSIAGTKPPE